VATYVASNVESTGGTSSRTVRTAERKNVVGKEDEESGRRMRERRRLEWNGDFFVTAYGGCSQLFFFRFAFTTNHVPILPSLPFHGRFARVSIYLLADCSLTSGSKYNILPLVHPRRRRLIRSSCVSSCARHPWMAYADEMPRVPTLGQGNELVKR